MADRSKGKRGRGGGKGSGSSRSVLREIDERLAVLDGELAALQQLAEDVTVVDDALINLIVLAGSVARAPACGFKFLQGLTPNTLKRAPLKKMAGGLPMPANHAFHSIREEAPATFPE